MASPYARVSQYPDDSHDRTEGEELSRMLNRDVLPVDSFQADTPENPAESGVESVIGTMKKFVEGLR